MGVIDLESGIFMHLEPFFESSKITGVVAARWIISSVYIYDPIILFDPIPGIRSGNIIIPLFIEISAFHHRWLLKSGLEEASNWVWAQSMQ